MNAIENEIRELFESAVELPVDRRGDFISSACETDEVRLQVAAMLAELDSLPSSFMTETEPPPALDRVPQRIGAFQIIRVLGQGGMGVVYAARQNNPQRAVALKVLRPEYSSHDLVRRFQTEGNVLARLDHPGIARIFESGTAETEFGVRPYFAMELVDGVRLDEWVTAEPRTLRAKLELICAVADAVHHAHTRGIVHRDLKPSNIFVTADGAAKVLDFGIARLTDVDLAQTMITESGQFLGTLAYSSPEQALGNVKEIDTCSDVYALGVVAYEVLAGALPCAIAGKPIHEAVKAIVKQPAPLLGTINRGLRGDVELIVDKALSKEKALRYSIAGEFAADLRRHLHSEPILARRASVWQQLSKFAARNKGLVVAALAIVFSLLLGTIAASYGFWRAARERDHAILSAQHADEEATRAEKEAAAAKNSQAVAESVTRLMTDLLAKANRTEQGGNPNVTVREALDIAAIDLARDGAAPDLVARSAALRAVGKTFNTLAEYDKAEAALRSALELGRKAQGSEPTSDLALTLVEFGQLLNNKGRFDEAIAALNEAQNIQKRTLGSENAAVSTSLLLLGQVYIRLGNGAQSIPYFRDAIEGFKKTAPDSPELADALSSLGVILKRLGEYPEAEQMDRAALDIFDRKSGPQSPSALQLHNNLGLLLIAENRLADAEPELRTALAGYQKLYGPDHPEVAIVTNSVAFLYTAQGQFDRAEPMVREALRINEKCFPPLHPIVIAGKTRLAVVLIKKNKYAAAEAIARDALESCRKTYKEKNSETAICLSTLGTALSGLGKFDEAMACFSESVSMFEQLNANRTPDYANVSFHAADCELKKGNLPAAKTLAERAYQVRKELYPADHPDVAASKAQLAAIIAASTRPSSE